MRLCRLWTVAEVVPLQRMDPVQELVFVLRVHLDEVPPLVAESPRRVLLVGGELGRQQPRDAADDRMPGAAWRTGTVPEARAGPAGWRQAPRGAASRVRALCASGLGPATKASFSVRAGVRFIGAKGSKSGANRIFAQNRE